MSKHEQLVNQIAEEMANNYNDFTDSINVDDQLTIDHCKMHARIAVKHMAEMYEAGYMVGRSKSDPLSYIGLKTMLTHLGLIPQTGEEAGEK